MKIHVLGRDRWYYSNRFIARLKALYFKLLGYSVIIKPVYLLKDGTTKLRFIGFGERVPEPDDSLGERYQVIPFHPVPGNFSRSCA